MRLSSLLCFLLLGFSPLANAGELFCSAREDVVQELVADYDEQLAAVRDMKGEGLLEIHVSPRTGTWTALLTRSGQLSCVVASGDNAPIPEFLVDVEV